MALEDSTRWREAGGGPAARLPDQEAMARTLSTYVYEHR
jgi:hypothetical protein